MPLSREITSLTAVESLHKRTPWINLVHFTVTGLASPLLCRHDMEELIFCFLLAHQKYYLSLHFLKLTPCYLFFFSKCELKKGSNVLDEEDNVSRLS